MDTFLKINEIEYLHILLIDSNIYEKINFNFTDL